MGRLQDATLELQRALDLDPLSPVNNALMAYLSYARGEYDQAMAHQRRTVDLEPDWYFPHLLLAIAHSYRGDFAQAIEGESVSKTGQFSRIVKKSVRRRPSPA